MLKTYLYKYFSLFSHAAQIFIDGLMITCLRYILKMIIRPNIDNHIPRSNIIYIHTFNQAHTVSRRSTFTLWSIRILTISVEPANAAL